MSDINSYKIISSPGYGGYEEKKSRFLAEAVFADTEEAVQAELLRVRKQYYDARHHCSARVLGAAGNDVRSSDDGEPAGTAGKPILEVIRGAGVTNCLVVVTRYFGNIKLGTGGLVRAYTAAAKAALENAVISRLCLCDILEIIIGYPQYDRIRNLLEQKGLSAENPQFTDRVSMTVRVRLEDSAALQAELISLTGGSASISSAGQGYYPMK